MSSKLANAVIVAVAIAVPAYWYWSPYVAMRSMRAAAQAKDADAFNAHVDYPKLRESLKGQFSAMMADTIQESGRGGSEMEKAGASLGAMLGLAIADRFIDAMVRPEFVMKSMAEAKLDAPGAEKPTGGASTNLRDVHWTVERKGMDRVIAYGSDDAQEPVAKRVGFVFDRNGFATWKLSEIRLPAKN